MGSHCQSIGIFIKYRLEAFSKLKVLTDEIFQARTKEILDHSSFNLLMFTSLICRALL